MNMHLFFIALGVLAIGTHVVTSILVMAALDRAGYKTSILLSRLYIFKYLAAYKEITRRQTGLPGTLFYLWIGSINLAAVAVIGMLFT